MNTERKRRPDPEQDLGKPDETELHPRIEHAPHLHDGHPVVKGTTVRVGEVLLIVARTPLAVPPTLHRKSNRIAPADVQASLQYGGEWLLGLPVLLAELTRLRTRLALYEERRR